MSLCSETWKAETGDIYQKSALSCIIINFSVILQSVREINIIYVGGGAEPNQQPSLPTSSLSSTSTLPISSTLTLPTSLSHTPTSSLSSILTLPTFSSHLPSFTSSHTPSLPIYTSSVSLPQSSLISVSTTYKDLSPTPPPLSSPLPPLLPRPSSSYTIMQTVTDQQRNKRYSRYYKIKKNYS